jgi:hypothetical protein
MHAKGVRRPPLFEEERKAAMSGLADDIRDLERVTGESYADWLSGAGRGDFIQRRMPQQRHLP